MSIIPIELFFPCGIWSVWNISLVRGVTHILGRYGELREHRDNVQMTIVPRYMLLWSPKITSLE